MREDYRGALFVALQRLLPQHILSRLLARLAEAETPWLKSYLIRRFITAYGVDVTEAERTDILSYHNFNDFFTRALRPGARSVDPGPNAIVSPADGAISQIGTIHQGELIQAKGHRFTTTALLGGDAKFAAHFDDGRFVTIYLAPKDYHRVHMPVAGKLTATLYIPGRLFSVNRTAANHIPNLFVCNERLVCLFDTKAGVIAVVLVGALFVAGIETTWQASYSPGVLDSQRFDSGGKTLAKGEEMGRFKFGSTVIVLCPAGLEWDNNYGADTPVQMGQRLGLFARQATH
ncbi:MAG: archaetidylserine decarboxylase [Porticoccaceae bacterium]